MIVNVYVWYDSKAMNFSTPMFLVNDDVAVRQFGMACSDLRSEMGYAPDDFTLYRVGTYDTKTCHIEFLASPEFIRKGDTVV